MTIYEVNQYQTKRRWGGGRSIFFFAREEMVQRRMQNFWFIGLSVLGIVLPDRLIALDQRI